MRWTRAPKDYTVGENKIEIEFSNEEQLAHIVDLLVGPGTWS